MYQLVALAKSTCITAMTDCIAGPFVPAGTAVNRTRYKVVRVDKLKVIAGGLKFVRMLTLVQNPTLYSEAFLHAIGFYRCQAK